jgi:hypothetical protein
MALGLCLLVFGALVATDRVGNAPTSSPAPRPHPPVSVLEPRQPGHREDSDPSEFGSSPAAGNFGKSGPADLTIGAPSVTAGEEDRAGARRGAQYFHRQRLSCVLRWHSYQPREESPEAEGGDKSVGRTSCGRTGTEMACRSLIQALKTRGAADASRGADALDPRSALDERPAAYYVVNVSGR